MDHTNLLTVGGQPVNVVMLTGAVCITAALVRCWTRGKRDPSWDAPTRLRHDAHGARIFSNWMWAWLFATAGGAFYFDDAFMFAQCLAPAFLLYAAHRKEAILEDQAAQVEACMNGDTAPDGPLNGKQLARAAKGPR